MPGHPLDGSVIPLAGLGLVAQLPVGHGQKEPLVGVPARPQFQRLLARLDYIHRVGIFFQGTRDKAGNLVFVFD